MATYWIEPTEKEELALISLYANAYTSSTTSTAATTTAATQPAIDWKDDTTGADIDLSTFGLSPEDASWYREQAPRYYTGDLEDNPELGAYWNLYGDPADTTQFWETQAGVDWLKAARSGGDAERDLQAAADDDGFLGLGDFGNLLLIGATIYIGGTAAGLWGGAEGAVAAGAAEGVAAGGAMDMGVGLAEMGLSGATAVGTTIPELGLVADAATADAAIAGGIDAATLGAGETVASPLSNLSPNIGDLPAAESSMPPAIPETPPPGSTTTPFDSASGAPATVTTVNPAPAVIAPAGLVDQAIQWAGKQIGKELLVDALAPDAQAAAPAVAPAKTPFSFFGDMPWSPRATQAGAPGLTRLSSGQSVFGASGLRSPALLASRMGRG